MVSVQDLALTIEDQVALLRRRGRRAQLLRSPQLLRIAIAVWRNNPTQANQFLWRRAAIADGVTKAFEGNWGDALLSLDTNPYNVPHNHSGYPVPRTIPNVQLTAMMLVNGAVCGMNQRLPSNGSFRAATDALGYLEPPGMLGADAARYDRWRAVAHIISAMERLISGQPDRARSHLALAIATLDQRSQPQLLAFAQKLASGSRAKTGWRRPPALRPEECLYYFNE